MSTSGKEVQRRFWTSQEVSRLPGLVRASVWLGSDLLQLLGAAISHLWRGEHYEKTRLCLGLEPFWLNSHGMPRAAPITNTHEQFYELLIEIISNYILININYSSLVPLPPFVFYLRFGNSGRLLEIVPEAPKVHRTLPRSLSFQKAASICTAALLGCLECSPSACYVRLWFTALFLYCIGCIGHWPEFWLPEHSIKR